MNKLEVNQVGGFPMTTRILDEIQKAHAVFNAFGGLAGNFTILDGCVTVGSNVGNGFVFINGEVLEFRGGLSQTKVIIKEDVENLVFQNGNSNPVIKTRYVTFGTGVNAIDWVDFKRPIETKALEALLGAINTSLTAITTKLATIDVNAKVQVNTDWNATSGKAQLLNKPAIGSPFLAKGSYPIGDVSYNDDSRTITFQDIGTANYMVMGTIVSTGNQLYDNDVTFVIKGSSRTATGFVIVLADHRSSTQVQDLVFDYVLIAK